MDDAQKATDKRIETIRKRLSAEYKQAEKELTKQVNEYYAQFKAADLKKRKLVKQGKLSQAEYIKWRENKMLYGKTMEQKVESMAQHLLNVDKQASAIVNKEMFGVYADNYNFAKFDVEKGLKINTSFTLFDEKTVERMAEKNPKLLRERKGDDGKIIRWSRRKVSTAITQGVLQGEPIDKIAKRLQKVVGMEEGFAMTNARTAMTAAQNAGRLDSLLNSKTLGIKVKKQWMATLDERTRSSHQALDGEIVDLEKPFSNGLKYPGDPDGAPGEIYNCRCTMIGAMGDYPRDKFERYDNIAGKPIENVTFEEWSKAKSNQTTDKALFNRNNIKWSESGRLLKDALEHNKVEYRSVKKLSKELNENEIIEKIGGGDKTKGSCVSLCYAYVGNKHGLDVYDFRGGNSREVMSFSLYNTPALNKVLSKVEKGGGTRAANKLISTIEEGKEYILGTGRHAAIIRKHNGKVEYLELQTENNNGWHELTNDVLKNRFACSSSYKSSRSELIDVDSLKDSDEFRELLGYINTKEKDQKKGRGGFEK